MKVKDTSSYGLLSLCDYYSFAVDTPVTCDSEITKQGNWVIIIDGVNCNN